MKKTNFFVKFKNNLYNLKTFPQYVKEGFGRSVVYGLILFLIIGAVQGVYMGYNINEVMSQNIKVLEESKNDFSIKDGELELSESPKEYDTSETLLYADSKIEVKDATNIQNKYENKSMYMLFLKDGIKVEGGGMNSTFYYKDLYPNGLTKADIIDQIKTMGKIIIVVAVIMYSLMTIVNTIIKIVIIAAIGTIIGIALRIKVKYKAMVSLGIYAMTLPSLLLIPMNMFYNGMYSDVVLVLTTVIFIAFILKDIKNGLMNKIS